jgi:GNAT superfamily N-acetyltransferase
MTSPEPTPALSFKPVTGDTWAEFDALFKSPGGPKHCWCMVWRRTPEELREHPQGRTRRPLIKGRVDRGETIGLVGSLEGTPVAWVSIAPRETYRDGLGGPEAAKGERVWSLACFFLKRGLRNRGYGASMLEAAIAYARKSGATVLEAYPVDPEAPSYRFMGFVPAFERLGFTEVGTAGSRRHVMRLDL